MSAPTAPQARRSPVTSICHGISRQDDYAWLRAENWQQVMQQPGSLDDEIRAYLEAENTYTEQSMADCSALQESLFEEMKGRIPQNDSSVPAPDGDYEYYSRYVENQQYPVFCRKRQGTGIEQVLVDGNRLAEGETYFNIRHVAHSPDHRRIAYAFDNKGSEYYTIRVIEADSGQAAGADIADSNGDPVWAADCQTLFYTKLDAHHRPSQIHRCHVDTGASALVYEEPDSGFFAGIGTTQSRAFIIIDCHDHQTSEIRLIPADRPEAEPQLILPRQTGHEYEVEHHGEHLYISTNLQAEDFRIVRTALSDTAPEHWQEITPHKSGRLILHHSCFAGHMVRLEREHGLPRIVIRHLDSGAEHEIAFDEDAYGLGMEGGYEFDTRNLRYSYSSMTTPRQVFDYDMDSQQRVLRKTQAVPSGHEPDNYETKRIYAAAADGKDVPITLFYRKGLKRDGSAPLLLYGYGAYGITIPASFSTNTLSLADRGFVYAIAHIRGGKDKGYAWYADGRRENKPNSFTDFIAAATFLVQEGYTSGGQIAAHGGSAGGMLMGAVANMAPELFGAVIADVPFVDVLNTMLDETLPLTPPEWPEWGNPDSDKAAYDTIAAYSPYDNVTAQNYPAILALAGLTDPRVTYWEPAKWVARLRALSTGNNLLLLKTNMDAGHGGASGRFDRLKELALSYAFVLKVLGKNQC